jgi:hypothetical protein
MTSKKATPPTRARRQMRATPSWSRASASAGRRSLPSCRAGRVSPRSSCASRCVERGGSRGRPRVGRTSLWRSHVKEHRSAAPFCTLRLRLKAEWPVAERAARAVRANLAAALERCSRRERWAAADAAHERPSSEAVPQTNRRNRTHGARREEARAGDGARHGVGNAACPGYLCSTAAMASASVR